MATKDQINERILWALAIIVIAILYGVAGVEGYKQSHAKETQTVKGGK